MIQVTKLYMIFKQIPSRAFLASAAAAIGSVFGTSEAAVCTRGRRSLSLEPSLLLAMARRGPDATALPHLQLQA